MASAKGTRVAIDIGGTFTDLVCIDGSGKLRRAKSDSTPAALEEAVLRVLDLSGVSHETIGTFIHGSTVVINAITERRGARTALVTTRGFRDVLEIARANRPDLYNLRYTKPEPFVARDLRFEVSERCSYTGDEVAPLSEVELLSVAGQLRELGIEAVAVAFLHAWVNPDHEAQATALLRRELPGVMVVASHEVSRQWREYERTNTTVLSAYVQPVVATYLTALEGALRQTGVRAQFYAMQSAGGVCSFDRALRAPITMLESGPVAGVMAAASLGRRIGACHVLSLDIGGTTAKTSALLDGVVPVNTLHHIERTPDTAGYPVQVPVVDIVEIGTGGGSIAYVDSAGGLHVGPRSAGAVPGPACYGKGGEDVTVTDANLLAGRLDPDFFLGGKVVLDVDAATRALRRLADALGVSPEEAARGVLRFAVAQMANALRLVTLRKGHDPRDFTLVASGGNGPLHAALLARELGINRIVIPPGPGHFSAFGMLEGNTTAQAVQTFIGPLATTDLEGLLARVERDAQAELSEPGAVATHYLELRYEGQEHTLEVPVPKGGDMRIQLATEFNARSQREYAFSLDAPLEVVACRVELAIPGQAVPWVLDDIDDVAIRPRSTRMVDFDQYGGVIETAIVDRRSLALGEVMLGPVVVEETASTTLVLPGQSASRDEHGNLIIVERHGD
jgi:N-methylhydantoinase A